tara:strand:- start:2811 stop:3224 length:414 start_codon:yes stop_codon:yes gene_type:complete
MAVYKLFGFDSSNTRIVIPSASDTCALSSTLDIEGGIRLKSRDINGNYNIVSTDYMIAVNTSQGAYSVTLPSASTNAGRMIIIKDETGNANTNNITINRSGTDMIDGNTNFVLNTPKSAVVFCCTGTTWLVISKYSP